MPRHAHRTVATNAGSAVSWYANMALARLNAAAMPWHAFTTMSWHADAWPNAGPYAGPHAMPWCTDARPFAWPDAMARSSMAGDACDAMSWYASADSDPYARTDNISAPDPGDALSAVLDAATAPSPINALSGANSAGARIP